MRPIGLFLLVVFIAGGCLRSEGATSQTPPPADGAVLLAPAQPDVEEDAPPAPVAPTAGPPLTSPQVCPEIAANETADELYPTYRYRCTPPEAYVRDGRALGFEDDPPIDRIRPGINVGPCSTSFLLTDDEGRFYLTQSAHCVWRIGSPTEDPRQFCVVDYKAIGNTTPIEGYAEPATIRYVSGLHMRSQNATEAECANYDFAIVEIPANYSALIHPAIRHIGGPTSLVEPLTIQFRELVRGYGNSDDRGLVVELATGKDHSQAPVWPMMNTFRGYYVGGVLDEAFCGVPTGASICTDRYTAASGYKHYVRYVPTKITGDSGSADLTEGGGALGVTSTVNFATGLVSSISLYDALLKIDHETGKRYFLVTWDEWSPDTIET